MKKILSLCMLAMMTISLSATTVYCKMTYSWWTADGAAVGVYYWGTTSDPSWPGIRMTSMGDGLWSYDLPADVKNLIFTRVNGSGTIADWGAQTMNLELPTDGKNLFTITNSSASWGGSNACTGEWSVYEGSGGGQGGTDPEEDDVNYYAMGWINGADAGETAYDTYEDKYLFVDGKLTINCTMGSYIAVKDHMGNFYYAEGANVATGNTVTLKWANGWSPCQKWSILEGTQYIIIRSAQFKGNIVLETVDKATYDAYHYGSGSQDIENTTAKAKAHKVIINGQLRIIRGDKMFDATGREL